VSVDVRGQRALNPELCVREEEECTGARRQKENLETEPRNLPVNITASMMYP
jgi:hypothetical protein